MRGAYFLAAISVATVAHAQGRLPPPIDLPFDAAYMVAAPGATAPLTNFDLAGAPPTLLLDLPPGASYDWFSYVGSTWRAPSGSSFSLNQYSQAQADKLWFTPSAATWASSKASGNWSIQANHSQVELIIIYGGGVGHEWARGSATVPFTVNPALPGDYNGSGAVNHDDYSVWQSAFDKSAQGDGNGDQLTNAADFTVWRDSMTASAAVGQTAAVPEPTTALLALLGAMLLRRSRIATRSTERDRLGQRSIEHDRTQLN